MAVNRCRCDAYVLEAAAGSADLAQSAARQLATITMRLMGRSLSVWSLRCTMCWRLIVQDAPRCPRNTGSLSVLYDASMRWLSGAPKSAHTSDPLRISMKTCQTILHIVDVTGMLETTATTQSLSTSVIA